MNKKTKSNIGKMCSCTLPSNDGWKSVCYRCGGYVR